MSSSHALRATLASVTAPASRIQFAAGLTGLTITLTLPSFSSRPPERGNRRHRAARGDHDQQQWSPAGIPFRVHPQPPGLAVHSTRWARPVSPSASTPPLNPAQSGNSPAAPTSSVRSRHGAKDAEQGTDWCSFICTDKAFRKLMRMRWPNMMPGTCQQRADAEELGREAVAGGRGITGCD